jgi:hypothetical protein
MEVPSGDIRRPTLRSLAMASNVRTSLRQIGCAAGGDPTVI